jgi:hypothetical protein
VLLSLRTNQTRQGAEEEKAFVPCSPHRSRTGLNDPPRHAGLPFLVALGTFLDSRSIGIGHRISLNVAVSEVHRSVIVLNSLSV